jgi:hypothetical protein
MSGAMVEIKGRSPGGVALGHDPGRLTITSHAAAVRASPAASLLSSTWSATGSFRLDRLAQGLQQERYALQPDSLALLPVNATTVQSVVTCAKAGVQLSGGVAITAIDSDGTLTHSLRDLSPVSDPPSENASVEDCPCGADDFTIDIDTSVDAFVTGWCTVVWPQERPLNLRFCAVAATDTPSPSTFALNDWLVDVQSEAVTPTTVMISYGSAERCGLPVDLPAGRQFLGELCRVATSRLAGNAANLSASVKRNLLPDGASFLVFSPESQNWTGLKPGAVFRTSGSSITIALVC